MDDEDVLANETRRAILISLGARELAAGEVARQFNRSASAISEHLSKLKLSGVVVSRSAGPFRIFRADPTVACWAWNRHLQLRTRP